MKILFATSECAPWVKTGGLGDVSAALPHALAALGHDVCVLIPAYGELAGLCAQASPVLELPAEGVWPAARLSLLERPGSFSLLLLDAPGLYDLPGGPYVDTSGRDHAQNARRFAFLGRVAARLAGDAPLPRWTPDVLHCNDWPSALAPAWQREAEGVGARRVPSVITIHNLAYQGLFPMETATALGLPPAWRSVDGAEFWGQLSFLKAGLQYADAITTVSPTYAREIRTEALGCGLHGLLEAKADRLVGILNGVDGDIWNPATDGLLPRRYSPDKLAGKRANRALLLERMGLAPDATGMLFGVVSRLASQKGIDLVAGAIPWLLANDCQLVVLGSGEAALQQQLLEAATAHPRHVGVKIGFDESLAHLIEAGADAFLMPSRYEPCGLNQMYSQVYGTPPIVHGTGGLVDSVSDFLADPEQATGFVMPEATLAALQAAMAQALLVQRQPARWKALQQRGMARDFGWARSAGQYVALYERLILQATPRRVGEGMPTAPQPSPLALAPYAVRVA